MGAYTNWSLEETVIATLDDFLPVLQYLDAHRTGRAAQTSPAQAAKLMTEITKHMNLLALKASSRVDLPMLRPYYITAAGALIHLPHPRFAARPGFRLRHSESISILPAYATAPPDWGTDAQSQALLRTRRPLPRPASHYLTEQLRPVNHSTQDQSLRVSRQTQRGPTDLRRHKWPPKIPPPRHPPPAAPSKHASKKKTPTLKHPTRNTSPAPSSHIYEAVP